MFIMTRHLLMMCCSYFLCATSGGLQYLLVFPSIDENDEAWEFQVMISTIAAQANVQVLGSNMSQQIWIQRDQPFRLYLDRQQLYLSNFFMVEEKAVLVKSESPILVHGHLDDRGSAGGYTAFPVERGDNQFIVTGYTDYRSDFNSDIIVAAVSDNTIVEVSFTNGSYITINLPAFGTYSIRSETDITGTLVAANGPIAVYSGHICANVPVNVRYCDRLIEGIPPLSYQGRNYIIPSIGGRSKDTGYIVRVLSVGLHGSLSSSENFYTNTYKEINFHSNIPRALNCTAGCFVYLYNKGKEADSSKSDPFMMRVVPVTHYANQLIWNTPLRSNASLGDQYQHYVSIIAPTEETSGVLVDGLNVVDQAFWSTIENSIFSVIALPMKDGLHIVNHTKSSVKMAAYAYGHGQTREVGYGFPIIAIDETVTSDGGLVQTSALYKPILLGLCVTTGLLLLTLLATWTTCFIKIRKRAKQGRSPPPRPPRIPHDDDRVYYTHLSGAGHSEPNAYQSMGRKHGVERFMHERGCGTECCVCSIAS